MSAHDRQQQALEHWCPNCHAHPGLWCRKPTLRKRKPPNQRLHVARGWLGRSCPTCKALDGDPCVTPTGRIASKPHTARIGRGKHEDLSWTERGIGIGARA